MLTLERVIPSPRALPLIVLSAPLDQDQRIVLSLGGGVMGEGRGGGGGGRGGGGGGGQRSDDVEVCQAAGES